MKKLGYSSYWMEVGSHGGISFTDALLVNKYTIKNGKNSNAKYQSEYYYLEENQVLPFGIITNSNLNEHKELNGDSRVTMQEEIYDSLFSDNTDIHTIYSNPTIKNVEISNDGNKTNYHPTDYDATLIYYVDIKGTQSLYFEAFDKYSNSLVESINEKISISCQGRYYSYPTQQNNGTIYLGTYSDRIVTVRINIKENISVSSFNVFSVNEDLLNSKINKTKDINLKVESNKISGTFEGTEDSYLFLPISYFKVMKAKINNKNTEVIKVFSSFVAIKLVEGTNNLKITYYQPGLSIGILLSLLGLTLLFFFILIEKKKKLPKIINSISYYITYLLTIGTFFVLYIFPIIMNILHQIK